MNPKLVGCSSTWRSSDCTHALHVCISDVEVSTRPKNSQSSPWIFKPGRVILMTSAAVHGLSIKYALHSSRIITNSTWRLGTTSTCPKSGLSYIFNKPLACTSTPYVSSTPCNARGTPESYSTALRDWRKYTTALENLKWSADRTAYGTFWAATGISRPSHLLAPPLLDVIDALARAYRWPLAKLNRNYEAIQTKELSRSSIQGLQKFGESWIKWVTKTKMKKRSDDRYKIAHHFQAEREPCNHPDQFEVSSIGAQRLLHNTKKYTCVTGTELKSGDKPHCTSSRTIHDDNFRIIRQDQRLRNVQITALFYSVPPCWKLRLQTLP